MVDVPDRRLVFLASLALTAVVLVVGGSMAAEQFGPQPEPPRQSRIERSMAERAQLRRLQDRISFQAHEADGFHVVEAEPDLDRNAVRIELITARTDHRAYFAERYGPHVRTKVIARTLTSPAYGDLFGWLPGADPAQIVLVFEAGGGLAADHAEVVEHADRLEVALVVQEPNGPTTMESRSARFTVTLAAPLGNRRVIDITTGQRLGRYDPLAP